MADTGEFKSCERPAPIGADDDSLPYEMESVPDEPKTEVEDDGPLPIRKSWDTFWPLERRAKIFAGVMALNVVLLPVSTLMLESWITIAITLGLNSLCQAIVLGTFDRLEVKRSPIGKVVVARTWRVAFVPLPAKRIAWREYESVCCRMSHEGHAEDWIAFFILIPYLVVPAILWYRFVIQPGRLLVSFCKDHGYPALLLIRSWDQAQANEVARTVAEATGRPWR